MPPTLFVSKFFLAAAESNLLEIDFDPVSQSERVLYPSLVRRPVVKVWHLDPKRSTGVTYQQVLYWVRIRD